MAASSCTGTVTQSAQGGTLVFADTGTYNPPVTSRILNIYDPNGQQLAQINMGSSLTADYTITADGWFQFVLTVIDNTGTFTCTVNFLATAFYQNAFANAIAEISSFQSDFLGVISNLNLSQDYYQAALRFFIGGFGVASQQMIQQANFYCTTPYYAN